MTPSWFTISTSGRRVGFRTAWSFSMRRMPVAAQWWRSPRQRAPWLAGSSLPGLAYVTYVGGWALIIPTLFFLGAFVPFAGIAFAGVALLSYMLSQAILRAFDSLRREEQQLAVDKVYSAAVNSFLNEAWTQLGKGAPQVPAPTPPEVQPPPAPPVAAPKSS